MITGGDLWDRSAPSEAGEARGACLQVGELRKPGTAQAKKLETLERGLEGAAPAES